MNIAVLASGTGSNARKIFQEAKNGRYGEANFLLISDNPQAGALEIARSFGIKGLYIDAKRAGARFSEEASDEYLAALKEFSPELIVLAGFMRILPPRIVAAYENRMINLHPSLLPLYKGKNSIKRALEAGDKFSGCSVHYVSNELDGGRVIAQKAVEISSSDTLESLTQKVHDAEHILLPQVVEDFVMGRLK